MGRIDILAFVPVADVMVLAKAAEKVAGTQEDGPGPVSSHQGRFFSKMGAVTGDPGLSADPAKALFVLEPVDTALPGAETAGRKESQGSVRPFYQFAVPMELHIGGFHHAFRSGKHDPPETFGSYQGDDDSKGSARKMPA